MSKQLVGRPHGGAATNAAVKRLLLGNFERDLTRARVPGVGRPLFFGSSVFAATGAETAAVPMPGAVVPDLLLPEPEPAPLKRLVNSLFFSKSEKRRKRRRKSPETEVYNLGIC